MKNGWDSNRWDEDWDIKRRKSVYATMQHEAWTKILCWDMASALIRITYRKLQRMKK